MTPRKQKFHETKINDRLYLIDRFWQKNTVVVCRYTS